MPYATLDDVQRRMPQFQLTATSKPNLDTAQVFLDDQHAQFDAAVENLGYVTPLTGAKSLAQAKEIIAQGVIAKVLYARAAAVGTDVAIQSADRAQKQYDHALECLASSDSPIEFTDAVRTDDQVTKPGIAPMGAFHGDAADDFDESRESRFSMETKF